MARCQKLRNKRRSRMAHRYYLRWKRLHPSHQAKYGHKFKKDTTKTKIKQGRRGIIDTHAVYVCVCGKPR